MAKRIKFITVFLTCFIILAAVIPAEAAITYNEPILGDIDGDGEVTIVDATSIQRWLVRLPVDSSIGEPIQQDFNNYEPIELNFIPVLEREEVSIGEDYHIYNTDELTPDILENRADGNVLIVERVFAQITDERPDISDGADGVIIGTDEPIVYRFMDNTVSEGTIMLTYLIYNPNNNSPDDVVNRYDFVLDRQFEGRSGL